MGGTGNSTESPVCEDELSQYAACAPYVKITFRGKYVVQGATSCSLGGSQSADSSRRESIHASWHWDGQKLTVRNDRLGFYPLFYFVSDDEISVSPSIRALIKAGAPADFDDAGIAAFLRLGFFLGEDTPFRRIRALPPNALLVWTRSQWKLEGGRTAFAAQHMNRKSALEGFIELFRCAIARSLPRGRARSAVLLTAGRDSRHILFELLRIGSRPQLCATVEDLRTDDCAVASELASAFTIPHLKISRPDLNVRTLARRNLKTSFCSDEHEWILNLQRNLRPHCEFFYDGIAGDVLSNGLFLRSKTLGMMREGRVHDFARAITPYNAASRMLSAEYAQRWSIEAARARVEQEAMGHVAAPNPISSFFFWNRTRREIALQPFALCSRLHACTPYLDAELVGFLSSLPADLFLEHNFHDQAIALAFPHLSELPYGSRPRPFPTGHMRTLAWESLRYLAIHQSGIINRGFIAKRLLRCLVDRTYAGAAMWLGNTPIYLIQLERLSESGAAAG
jgi:asparagine synthase (glutamine-hydrolysing)